jgi:hypothetical protein
MLYTEIMASCYEIHTTHTKTLCGQHVELLNAEPGGTYSDHSILKSLISPLKIGTQYNRRRIIPPTVYGTFTDDYEIKGFLLLKCPMLHCSQFWWECEKIQFPETPPQHDVAPIDDETGANNDVTHK